MQNFTTTRPKPNNFQAVPYACTFAFFWAGLTDYWAERSMPPLTSAARHEARRETASYWLLTLLVAFGLVCSIVVFVAWGSPGISAGLGLLGTKNLMQLSGLLVMGSTMLAFVGLPLWGGWKCWSFCHRMCRRGWELRTGQRQPCRLV